jgi:teichuronic acid biosynthesis glycosyltransferase TuaH
VPGSDSLRQLIVLSLKAWDDVWNRNNFLTDGLLRRNADLRVLFVEPPTDPLYDLVRRRRPTPPRFRRLGYGGRLHALRPVKLLPRRVGPLADVSLLLQVRVAARRLGLDAPVLWINDVTYAPLITSWRRPSLYDVSDDWLLAPFATREIGRLRELDALALKEAEEVVVCSGALAETRGAQREVTLIPNAVDVEHFRRPRDRPMDLPDAPVAVYAGTLHDARVDVPLVVRLASALPDVRFAFVGPDALTVESRRAMTAEGNVAILGARSYGAVPAYLQHADVIVVPHRVSPFMESLDPIKAYECLAVDTPTVATAVPGFREYPETFDVATSEAFAARVQAVLENRVAERRRIDPPTWAERAAAFEAVLERAAGNGR